MRSGGAGGGLHELVVANVYLASKNSYPLWPIVDPSKLLWAKGNYHQRVFISRYYQNIDPWFCDIEY